MYPEVLDMANSSKCSGHNICVHCRARGIECVYLPKSDNDGKQKRVKDSSDQNEAHQSAEPEDQTRETSISSGKASLSIEERIALLQEEVKRVASRSTPVQQQRRQDGEPSLGRRRVTFSSSAQYSIDFSQGLAEETDTFNFNLTRSRNLSLSSQLSALQELLSPRSASKSTCRPNKVDGRVCPLELPKPSRLRHLLDVYFREMDSFFPLLDKDDTQKRIFQALDVLGYSDYELIVDVDVQNHSIMALLCNMLVMGECMDPDEIDAEDSRPGWPIYIRGRKLLQQCSTLKEVDLDLVRYHTLSALYMMHSELLQSASHAISTALQIAMIARLNDQSSWGEFGHVSTLCIAPCTAHETCLGSRLLLLFPEWSKLTLRLRETGTSLEKTSRQTLWWTIYFLDRRISQRNGTPYLIRETEVAVEEFVSKNNPLGDIIHEDPAKSGTSSYCQVLVNFSKLWGQIWDTFFAAVARKRGDREEIEITDTRILFIRKQLPRHLTWNTDMVGTYMATGESEPQIRRRLALFIRINLLRMIIRQNPLLSSKCNEEGKQFCAVLAKDSIEAMAAFANACPRIRASGYFICTALVECIYHLVYILQDQTTQVDRAAAIGSFRAAYQLLVDFANTWITARRAVQALGTAIFSEGGPNSFFEAISERTDPSERMDDTPRDDGPASPDHDHSFNPQASQLDMMPVQTPTMTQISQQILQQEAQHLRYAGGSEFIHDLANSYGEMDFDCPHLIFGGT